MNKPTNTLILTCAILLAFAIEAASKTPKAKDIHSIVELDFKPAFCLPTNNFFKGFTPSAHLKYGFRISPETHFGSLYPHSVQGIGLGYNSFGDPARIGNPIALYVFQTSRITTLTEKLYLDYEWDFGLSFGWKPYDQETNQDNKIVGSKANAYINLGIRLNWQITNNLNIRTGIDISHFSNGNTSYPNAGVNTAGANIGLAWDFHGDRCPITHLPEDRSHHFWNYDIVLYGAVKKKGIAWEDGSATIVPNTFAVAGINFSPLYNINKYIRAGFSLDAQYDEGANISDHIANTHVPADDVRFHRPPFGEQFAAGLSVRAEFVMPYFSINLGLGRNIICKGKDTDGFYQTFVLKTHITRRTFLHIGYQVYNFRHPNNLMLGVGYSFGRLR